MLKWSLPSCYCRCLTDGKVWLTFLRVAFCFQKHLSQLLITWLGSHFHNLLLAGKLLMGQFKFTYKSHNFLWFTRSNELAIVLSHPTVSLLDESPAHIVNLVLIDKHWSQIEKFNFISHWLRTSILSHVW